MAMTLGACADADRSPFGKDIFGLGYADQTAALYRELLAVMPGLVADTGGFRQLWEEEDAQLTDSEQLIDRHVVTIEELPDVELAIVRIPKERPECHQYALHSRTLCSRLLIVHGPRVEFRYRYEGWVQFRSRRVAARVDLSDLAGELNAHEHSGGRWVFDGVDAITPALHLQGADATSLSADTILARLERHLRTGPPAWNPYN
jgi:hypothetical protein